MSVASNPDILIIGAGLAGAAAAEALAARGFTVTVLEARDPSAAGSAMARCIRMDRHRLRTLRSTNVASRVSLLMPCR